MAKLQFQCPAGASFYGKLCARWVILMMFELSLEVTIRVHQPDWLTTTTIMMIGMILTILKLMIIRVIMIIMKISMIRITVEVHPLDWRGDSV